jgi:hypothetical protein
MASSPQIESKATRSAARATLAKTLAPEEIRVGDFVTPLYMIAEVPSYYWFSECWNLPADQPVRMRFTCSSDGTPLKVKSICLPFVLVKQATGAQYSIDLRKCQVARLNPRHAKRAWRAARKLQQKTTQKR